jgi:hypothetical protein
MFSPEWVFIFSIMIGSLSALSGYYDWKWWMDTPSSKFMTEVFGRDNVRKTNIIIGIVAIIFVIAGIIL